MEVNLRGIKLTLNGAKLDLTWDSATSTGYTSEYDLRWNIAYPTDCNEKEVWLPMRGAHICYAGNTAYQVIFDDSGFFVRLRDDVHVYTLDAAEYTAAVIRYANSF